jgi:4'-phosphopantetheinyl transferase
VHVWRAELERPERSRFQQTLRHVLARYLDDEPRGIELIADEHGKPRLAEGRIHFNLSHSGPICLIAVCADREVGVDVERLAPQRDLVALAERALPAEDAAAVRSAAEPAREAVFYEHWARHEARLKCLGTGLGAPLPPSLPPLAIETLPVGPGYAAAVAAAGTGSLSLRCWTFDPPKQERRQWVS